MASPAPHRLVLACLGLTLGAAPLPALADSASPVATSSPISTSSPAVTSSPVATSSTTPTPRVAVAALPAPTIVMSRPAYSDSTMQGTLIAGRVTPAHAGVAVRLSVWRTASPGRAAHWSLYTSVVTRADGTFTARLGYNQGGIVRQLWRAEALLGSPARLVTTSFTESRLAMIDLATGPVSAAMVPLTYHRGCPVTPAMLTKVSMNFFGFDGRIHAGYLIVRSTDVSRIRSVFTDAFTAHFPMRVMQDPSVYRTDDNSMAADNTYGYFCRQVNGNPYVLSPHSSGHAVDVNTVENPYQKPNGSWYPVNGRPYVDRSRRRPGMLFADSAMTRSFLAHGYKWLSGFDWQHFQVR